MENIIPDKRSVKLIAHRGLSGLERENTCAAFIAAGESDYFGIETDVRKTSDGKFVLMHDDNTTRVTNGKYNYKIAETDFDTLRALKLPDLAGKERDDLKIPLLSEYINICKKYNKKCVLELKPCFEPQDIKDIIDEIEETGYLENVIFISFSLEYCVEVRRILRDAQIQWLADREATPEIISTVTGNRIDLDVYYKKLTKELLEYIHSLGLEVNSWTCDDVSDAVKLIDMGVEYITTNILK